MKLKLMHLLLLACASNLVSAQAQLINIQHFPPLVTVSQEIQPLVSGQPFHYWNEHPKTSEAWKQWVNQLANDTIKKLPALREQMHVSVESTKLAGVPSFIMTPQQIAANNAHRALLHLHGGGYVLNPGEAGTDEAIMMAGYGKIKVVSIDYRMPPDHPFPAAIDDVLAAYQALLKTYPAKNIGVFGTSTGGGMTLALMLKIKENNLPMPAAIVVGTPWTDLTKTGDSYFTHEGIDNVLVSYDGWLGDAAKLYANGHDLKDPLLSPIYGDVAGFPPTLLVTGTRDLFLSNTIRMHLKLRDAGNIADLIVLEGLSHAQYLMIPDSPEAKRYFNTSAAFFDKYLTNTLLSK